jgi:hypothetical protein
MRRGASNVSAGCVAIGCGIYGGLLLLGVVLMMFYVPETAIPMAVFALLPIAIAVFARRFISNRKLFVEEAALRLAEDPGVCAPLLQAIYGFRPELRKHAMECLKRLLPSLKASDSDAFPRSARRVLNEIVCTEGSYAYPPDFVLTCLESLAQIGDESSAKYLERLLNHDPRDQREIHLHFAARPILDALKLRLNEQGQAATLLRAASSDSAETLMRPSSVLNSEQNALLVRPAEDGSA